MDVEPLVPFRGHRRQMRRPVAGGLPYADPLEAWLEPLEDQPAVPWLLYGAAGVLAVIAAACAGCVVANVIWNRIYGDLMGS